MSIELEIAVGEDLDKLGTAFGYPRLPGETDQQMRGRLIRYTFNVGVQATPVAVCRAAMDATSSVLGVELQESRGHVRIRLELPLWRRLLVVPARRDRRAVRDAMPRVIPAGVAWEVR